MAKVGRPKTRTEEERKAIRSEWQRRFRASEKGKAWSYAYHRKPHVRAKKLLASRLPGNKERIRACEYKKDFGISIEDYEDMLISQKGNCAICGLKEKSGCRLSVDHDHKTKKVRGLLCGNCNRGIGLFKDDPFMLDLAFMYLNEHKYAQKT